MGPKTLHRNTNPTPQLRRGSSKAGAAPVAMVPAEFEAAAPRFFRAFHKRLVV